jgi:hypothetical protein
MGSRLDRTRFFQKMEQVRKDRDRAKKELVRKPSDIGAHNMMISSDVVIEHVLDHGLSYSQGRSK